MKSFASIDRIEGDYAVCEVELLEMIYSIPEYSIYKKTEMIDVPTRDIQSEVGTVREGDILVVEHDGMNVSIIYGRDEEEKARREEIVERIKKSMLI